MERKQAVYLAGGMSSGWQNLIMSKLHGQFTFYNPAEHAIENGEEYTAWDLHYVRCSDIVFAYMEESNPSGIGLSLEVGYARAMGKTVILVDERSAVDPVFAHRFHIVRETATITLNSLEHGLRVLLSFVRGVH